MIAWLGQRSQRLRVRGPATRRVASTTSPTCSTTPARSCWWPTSRSAERVAALDPQPEHLRKRPRLASARSRTAWRRGRARSRLRFGEAEIDPGAITNVYYTSGTTGPPKGCMVDHKYWRAAGALLSLRARAGTRRPHPLLPEVLLQRPLVAAARRSLHVGAALVVMRKFSVSRYWEVVREHDVTQLFTIGSIPALLLSASPVGARPRAQGALRRAGRGRRGPAPRDDRALGHPVDGRLRADRDRWTDQRAARGCRGDDRFGLDRASRARASRCGSSTTPARRPGRRSRASCW